MRNVYCVKLAKPVKTEPAPSHFSGRESTWLYVVASSFANAAAAVEAKHPGAEVRGIDLMNYTGIPIVLGD
jgi:hypothetical protein